MVPDFVLGVVPDGIQPARLCLHQVVPRGGVAAFAQGDDEIQHLLRLRLRQQLHLAVDHLGNRHISVSRRAVHGWMIAHRIARAQRYP